MEKPKISSRHARPSSPIPFGANHRKITGEKKQYTQPTCHQRQKNPAHLSLAAASALSHHTSRGDHNTVVGAAVALYTHWERPIALHHRSRILRYTRHRCRKNKMLDTPPSDRKTQDHNNKTQTPKRAISEIVPYIITTNFRKNTKNVLSGSPARSIIFFLKRPTKTTKTNTPRAYICTHKQFTILTISDGNKKHAEIPIPLPQ